MGAEIIRCALYPNSEIMLGNAASWRSWSASWKTSTLWITRRKVEITLPSCTSANSLQQKTRRIFPAYNDAQRKGPLVGPLEFAPMSGIGHNSLVSILRGPSWGRGHEDS